MKKQFLILLLVCLASISASAYDFEVDGIYYNVSGSEATVTSGDTNYSGSVIISSSVTYSDETYSVSSIGDYAFYWCSGLTSVTIPASVTSIGEGAFSYCSGLTSVTIPNSVTSIGAYAFYGCTGLTSVTIPESVTSIGTYAFYECSGLTSVTIPNYVTSIGNWAFGSCSGLTTVTIPESVTSIGEGAFSVCSSLQAFYGKYASSDNRCLIVDGTMNSFAPAGITSYTIPNSVISIDSDAFYGCSGLTSVTIPNSVTSIGNSVFYGCTGLTSVTIPESVTSIGDYAFWWCTDLTSVTIPNSVTSIGEGAFRDCSSLQTFYGKYASSDNRCLIVDGTLNSFAPAGITSYTIPNSVTSIGYSAFGWCSGLTSVTIPESVTSIDTYAFYGCTGLTSVSIPNSVTSIGGYAFDYCSGLKAVTVNNPDPAAISIGRGMFENVSTQDCTLFVPNGSRNSYATASQWSSFGTFVEFEPGYSLVIEPQQIRKGKTGVLPVMLENTEGVTALQFDLKLPNGISIQTDEYGDFVIEPTERCDNTHVFASSMVDGCVRIVGYSSKNHPYSGTEGAIINLPVTLSDDVQQGSTMVVEVKAAYLTMASDLAEITVPNTTSMVEILSPYIPGDVNDDGHFTATDVACCISFILDKPAEGAFEEPADANCDGKITAADAATIVSYILGGNTIAQSAQMRAAALAAEEAGEDEAETETTTYYMNPITVDAGETTATLEVGLRNPDVEAITLQCDIVLPEGVTVETDQYGDPIVELTAERSAGHVILASKVGERTYRVLSYSNLNRAYNGTDGIIFTMPLIVDAPQGEYTIDLIESLITESGTLHEFVCPSPVTTNLTVVDENDTQSNTFAMDDVTTVTENETTMVPVMMNNESPIIGYQCDITLPECMSLGVNDDGHYAFTQGDRTDDHELSSSKLEGLPNTYRVVCISSTDALFEGNSGVLFNIPVVVEAGTPSGEYVIEITNIVLTKEGDKQIDVPNVNAMLVPETRQADEITWPINLSEYKYEEEYLLSATSKSGLPVSFSLEILKGNTTPGEECAELTVKRNKTYLIVYEDCEILVTASTEGDSEYRPAEISNQYKFLDGKCIEDITAGCTITYSDKEAEDVYYDLMGRRVENPTHGIYIRNGKKMLVK